ncbi:MAG: ImmA/IrrE family metallo-endopeptidase [Methylocystis sp.]
MLVDHKVSFRSYETLMALAMRERKRWGVDHLCQISFRRLIENYIATDSTQNDKPQLVLFEREADPYFDRIKLTLNANEGLWEEAGYREPLACFKLLHELAHILLHRHPKQRFSSADRSQINFAQNEESAEWQANVFAALFMAPPYLAIDCEDRASFLERFNYPPEYADFWFELRRRRPLTFAQEFCPECGTQKLAQIASNLRCTNCGYTPS